MLNKINDFKVFDDTVWIDQKYFYDLVHSEKIIEQIDCHHHALWHNHREEGIELFIDVEII